MTDLLFATLPGGDEDHEVVSEGSIGQTARSQGRSCQIEIAKLLVESKSLVSTRASKPDAAFKV